MMAWMYSFRGTTIMTQTIGFYVASAVASAYALFLLGTHMPI